MIPRSPAQRRIRGIIISASLAFLTTIGLAWAIAYFIRIPSYMMHWQTLHWVARGDKTVCFCETRLPGLKYQLWGLEGTLVGKTPVQTSEEMKTTAQRLNPSEPTGIFSSVSTNWGTASDTSSKLAPTGSDAAFGWPFVCLWYQVQGADPTPQTAVNNSVRGGLLIMSSLQPSTRLATPAALPPGPPDWPHVRALPYCPIWQGLAIDFLIYGVCWWYVLCGRHELCWWRRRRQGHCTFCNYDLLADYSRSCPECGRDKDRNLSEPPA